MKASQISPALLQDAFAKLFEAVKGMGAEVTLAYTGYDGIAHMEMELNGALYNVAMRPVLRVK